MDLGKIRELRERTFLGMSECKSALVEANDNVDLAVEILKKRGSIRKEEKLVEAKEGIVKAIVNDNYGQIVEINTETDFAAKSDIFLSFVDDFLNCVHDDLIQDRFDNMVLLYDSLQNRFDNMVPLLSKQLGESIFLKKYNDMGVYGNFNKPSIKRAYNHHNNKISVLLSVYSENNLIDNSVLLNFMDDVAMHIAASNPIAISRKDDKVSSLIEKQKTIFMEQMNNDPKPKPDNIKEKIVNGKVDKWLSEIVLLEQESLIHPKKTIKMLKKEVEKEIGCEIELVDFIRYELGQK